MANPYHPHSLASHQRGAALVTGLLIMIVMTLIGITTMQSSITQGNLATNAQLNAIGFQATEAALAWASNDTFLLEQALDNGVNVGTDSPNYRQSQAVLDIQISSDNSEDRTTTPISTTIQTTPLGETICPRATALDSNDDLSLSPATCTAFALVATTVIGNGVQTRTRHTQISARLMPSPPGGMPAYRPNQQDSNSE